MPLPDVCLAQNYDGAGSVAGGAGPGAPSGTDGVTPVAPGGPAGSAANTGPLSGPLSGYNPGYGSAMTGWPYVMLTTGMRKDVYVQLFDNVCGGAPTDLTGIDHLKFISKEVMWRPEIYFTKDCIVIDAATGLLKIRFKPSDIPFAGIWPSGIVAYNSANEVIAEFKCYLYINPSITTAGTSYVYNFPVQPHEIRLAMRDYCPSFNTLLDDLEFSDIEIIFAVQRPVDEWNETPPDLQASGFRYTYNTFPWREHWRQATIGYLLQAGAIHQQRNNFTYAAGGVSVNDKDKATPYLGISERLLANWREWLLTKKREINIGLCYGSINSLSFGYPFNYTDRTW